MCIDVLMIFFEILVNYFEVSFIGKVCKKGFFDVVVYDLWFYM